MLLDMLRRMRVHSLPFTDKSDPEAIRQEFGISKGQFKRAVGHLLKARLVSMVNGKLILIKDPDDE
ncbi:DNA-binding protein, partial [Bifidobacterium longum]|nr:DNA-binding protein [Bifidobacterium longum]